MTLRFLRPVAAFAALVLIHQTARAAYNPAVVPADARWVVYADFATLRNGTLGKELIATFEKAQPTPAGGAVGINFAKVLSTIGSITMYGAVLPHGPDTFEGAAVVQGTEDLRKIVESALLQANLGNPDSVSELSGLSYPAYVVRPPKNPEGKAQPAKKGELVVAFPPEPVLLLGSSREQVVKARDAFRGSATSLAKTLNAPLAQLGRQSEGAYLFAAAIVPPDAPFPPNSVQTRVVQLLSSGAIAIGERGANAFAHAELLASSDQNAEKLLKILQGFTSVLSLTETNDKQLGEFLNATAVTRDNQTISLQLAYPSARLVQMTQSLRTQGETRGPGTPPQISAGTVVAQWSSDTATAPSTATATAGGGETVTRTVDGVKLTNGGTVTFGRALNGGKGARLVSVEIVPTEGGGAPLVFRPEFMRNLRGTMWQFQFPGADGTYQVKVNYVPDAEGKATYALSVRSPNEPKQNPPGR